MIIISDHPYSKQNNYKRQRKVKSKKSDFISRKDIENIIFG